MEVILKNNSGFQWYKNNTISIKGYFYDAKNTFYEGGNALAFLSKIKNKKEFIEVIEVLNGAFSIVLKIENSICIASDITRSFPIFYTSQNGKLFISDDILFLKKKFNIQKFDDLAAIEFKASLHSHGKKTLLKNVFQVQSSEYLIFEKNIIINQGFFFSYATDTLLDVTYDILKKETVSHFENVFKRLITSLNNRTVVIPLSGGFDSRLITVFLKKYNYKNVVCFTYGRKDSFEIENSKKTAKALGFEWYFIEYTQEIIQGYLQTQEFKEYVHFAGKFSSMPNLQEYFAVKYLKEQNLVPNDAIFIPGYAGDILGGSEYLNTISNQIKTSEVSSLLLKKKFSNHKLTKQEIVLLRKEIENNLFIFDKNHKTKIPSTVFEDYNIKERISKYIFNSASFYTFFGYQHRFPFWDKELLEFFKNVPIEFKKMKLLFDDVLIEYYFKPFNVYFESELKISKRQNRIQKVKNRIRPFFPTFIKQIILQINDWNNYKPITQQMIQSLKDNSIKVNKKSKSYNEVIAQWYLHFSKKTTK